MTDQSKEVISVLARQRASKAFEKFLGFTAGENDEFTRHYFIDDDLHAAEANELAKLIAYHPDNQTTGGAYDTMGEAGRVGVLEDVPGIAFTVWASGSRAVYAVMRAEHSISYLSSITVRESELV